MSARGFLQAALVLFALFLIWRFLTGIVTVALVLLTGLLLAVALSGPVEALHRRKVPRALGAALIAVGVLSLLSVIGYLLLPVLGREFSKLTTALPATLSYLDDRIESLAGRFGLEVGSLSSPECPALWEVCWVGRWGCSAPLPPACLGRWSLLLSPSTWPLIPAPPRDGWSDSSRPRIAPERGICFSGSAIASYPGSRAVWPPWRLSGRSRSALSTS